MRNEGNVGEFAYGLAGVVIGTILALGAVPSDPGPAGALFLPAIFMSGGLLVGALACIPRGYAAMLRGENILNMAIVYWLLLDLLQGAYDLDTSQEVVYGTFFALGLLALGIWIGAGMRSFRLPELIRMEVEAEWTSDQIFAAGATCFLLGMLTYAVPTDFDIPEMFSHLGGSRWSAPWSRGQLGGIDAIWDHFQYFGYVLPILFVAHGGQKGWINLKTILLLAMALVMLAFLAQGGGRRLIGVTVGAALIYRILSARNARTWGFLTSVVGAVALLYAMQWMLQQRGVGWFVEADASYNYLHVDDNFLRLGQLIELVPDTHPYAYLQLIYFIVVRPIPRILWPGKPIDPGFDLPSMIGDTGASLSYSAIGDWYLIWGFPTVFLGGLFFGRLAAFLNAMIAHQKPDSQPVVISVALMVLFASMRSLQDLVIMSYAILGWLLVSHFVQKYTGRGKSASRPG